MSSVPEVDHGYVDAHRHVWNRSLHRYPWLDDLDLRAGGAPAQVELDWRDEPSEIEGVVLVEAGAASNDADSEASTLCRIADSSSRPTKVVAAMDWAMPRIEPLLSSSWASRIAGVRLNLIQARARESALSILASRVSDAVSWAGSAGMTVDVLCGLGELDVLTATLDRISGVSVVLNHLGNPSPSRDFNDDATKNWLAALKDLAGHPDLFVKLSGLPARAEPSRPIDTQITPFLRAAFELFGPKRTMLGSDWPISRGHPDIPSPVAWFQTVERCLGVPSDPDLRRGTALRFYFGKDR